MSRFVWSPGRLALVFVVLLERTPSKEKRNPVRVEVAEEDPKKSSLTRHLTMAAADAAAAAPPPPGGGAPAAVGMRPKPNFSYKQMKSSS
ncbi:hypothetical protein RUM43_002631 [Polyplax serrata]|uniref:Uncharacterized protein n=1 Tax=Polyplax serrata TaxID=468196 RepID=A0AAN8NV02_POLSC